MRMRRLKWAETYIKESKEVVAKPEEYKNKWNTLVSQPSIHIEIGTGKGDYWLQMALKYKDCAWIGIEKNESVAALALRKAAQTDNANNNRLFIYGDATHLDNIFGTHEVDVIHLNFSDPWPKNRTSKRRLSSHAFLKQYATILKPDGEIQMKSDNRNLFEYSLLTFQQNDFELVDVSLDFRSTTHDEDVISEYEDKFMSENKPIYRGVWKKKKEIVK